MTQSLFTHIDIAAPYAVPIGILAGALAGFVHFTTLRRNTAYFAGGLFGKAFALQSARFAVLVIILALTARLGWPALVAATASLTLVRMLIIRRERGTLASVADRKDPAPTPPHKGEGLTCGTASATPQPGNGRKHLIGAGPARGQSPSPLWGGVGAGSSCDASRSPERDTP